MKDLNGKRIAVLIDNTGVEQVELTTPWQALGGAGAQMTLVAPKAGTVQAFNNDVGWRIDYHLATPRLARTAVAAGVDREPSADARVSDHAPVVVDYAT